jgi:uncharacterized membrane protein YbaN (DUF454 family)
MIMNILFGICIIVIQGLGVIGFVLLGIGAIGINLNHAESGHAFAIAGGYCFAAAFIVLAIMLTAGAIHKKLYPNYKAE